MPHKFDRKKTKFRRFVQQIRLFLRLHPSTYPDEFTKVGFVNTLLSDIALSWFVSLLEKKLICSIILKHLWHNFSLHLEKAIEQRLLKQR